MIKIIYLLITLYLSHFTLQGQTFIEERRFGGFGTEPGKFNQPHAIAISQNRVLYVVDTGNNRIQLFDLQGNFIKTVGGFGFGDDQFDRPIDIWVKSIINIYVSDYNNERLLRYDGNMNYLSSLESNSGDAPEFQFYEVASCAVSSQKDLFFLDHGENKIIKINRSGQNERSIGTYESGEGQLEQPVQLDVVNQQYLIVSDISEGTIVKFDFFGNYLGKLTAESDASFSGICVSNRGAIFASDPINKKLYWTAPGKDQLLPIVAALQEPLTKPQDCAVHEEKVNNNIHQKLYLIDGDEILIGKFVIQ